MADTRNFIQETYEEMENGHIFRDRFYFDTDEYKPTNIVGRNEQIARIKMILKPLLQRDRPGKPQNGMLAGPPGSGKTVIINAFLQHLDEWLAERQRSDIVSVYINCAAPNTSAFLASILRAIRENSGAVYTKDVPTSGISVNEYFRRIFKEANLLGKRLIIVFDEIDKLKEKDFELLYPFIRPKHMYALGQGVSVSIIGIANSNQWMTNLDPRDVDALNEIRITFPHYVAPDLIEILTERAQGFMDGALEEGVIEICAALAAQDAGNARYAIKLLFWAGLIAEERDATTVTARDVYDAQIEINRDETVKQVEDAPAHQKAILTALISLGDDARRKPVRKGTDASTALSFASGDVYRRYCEICTEIDMDALRYRRIFDITKEMAQVDLIDIAAVHGGRRGLTRQISLKVDRDAAIIAIKKNAHFTNLPITLSDGSSGATTLDAFS